MKYKKIAEKLIELVDSTLFNDVWFYIKDFTNYKLLFILQSYPDNSVPPSIDKIDNQSNFLIGTLGQKGFIDYLGCQSPIIFNDYYKEENTSFINPLEKYNGLTYNYHNLYINSLIEVPASMHLKIDETVWLLLLNHRNFRTKIIDFQRLLNEYHVSPDPADYFDYFFHLVSVTEYGELKNYSTIVEMDCDEIDPKIVFTDKLFEEALIEKARMEISKKVLLTEKLMSMPNYVEKNLKDLDIQFLSAEFTSQLIQNYHKVIEIYVKEIHKFLFPKIIINIEKIVEEEKKDRFKKIIKDIKNYKKELNFLNIADIANYLGFLIDSDSKFTPSVLGINSKIIINNNLKQLNQYHPLSKYRNLAAHTFDNIDNNIGMSTIYAFRWIIEFLDRLYYELKEDR